MISALVDGPQGVAARARRTCEHLLDAQLERKSNDARVASA
jgi:hypothetical protein